MARKSISIALFSTLLATLGLALLGGCLAVPGEVPAQDRPRKATAWVDHLGRQVGGGNLIVDIPPGAVAEGDRIQVTIDQIIGAPDGHTGEVYLVGPVDYEFHKTVQLQYRYSAQQVIAVQDTGSLFLGSAQGLDWSAYAPQHHDLEARRLVAETRRLAVVGLVDASALGNSADLAGSDDDDNPVTGDQTGTADPADLIAPLRVELTWEGGSSDLDLHLLRGAGEAFGADDCYWANCRQDGDLDWTPSGPAGNPIMELDDVSGYGPETTRIDQPVDGSYGLAVHVYSINDDALPLRYQLRVLQGEQELVTLQATAAACGELLRLADLEVSDAGRQVRVVSLDASPVNGGNGPCQ